MIKNLFSSLDFVDDFPKDPLTGGDVHIDCIKAHLYYDYIYIELWSCCLDFQIYKVNIELDL